MNLLLKEIENKNSPLKLETKQTPEDDCSFHTVVMWEKNLCDFSALSLRVWVRAVLLFQWRFVQNLFVHLLVTSVHVLCCLHVLGGNQMPNFIQLLQRHTSDAGSKFSSKLTGNDSRDKLLTPQKEDDPLADPGWRRQRLILNFFCQWLVVPGSKLSGARSGHGPSLNAYQENSLQTKTASFSFVHDLFVYEPCFAK